MIILHYITSQNMFLFTWASSFLFSLLAFAGDEKNGNEMWRGLALHQTASYSFFTRFFSIFSLQCSQGRSFSFRKIIYFTLGDKSALSPSRYYFYTELSSLHADWNSYSVFLARGFHTTLLLLLLEYDHTSFFLIFYFSLH